MGAAVVITGASGGIGTACVSRLSKSGFTVLAAVRNDVQASSVASGVIPFRLDLSNGTAIESAVDEIRSHGLPLEGLVNNAGMSRAGAIEDLSLDAFREVLEVNLFGPLQLTRLLLPELRATQGRIVIVGSGEGFLATPLNSAYCMAKHALEALSASLRFELRASGVKVSVISPGQTETKILERAFDGADLEEGEVVRLFAARGREFSSICRAADELGGDEYVCFVNQTRVEERTE